MSVSIQPGHGVFCIRVATKADHLARLSWKVTAELVLMGSREGLTTLILPGGQSSPLPITPGRTKETGTRFQRAGRRDTELVTEREF